MLQHVVRYADQRIFLAEHVTVLADECQTVNIRIDNNTEISLAFAHQIADLRQVLRDRFGVMGKVSVGRAVQADNVLYTQCFEHCRYSQTANGVDTIDGNGEVRFAYSLCIHELEVHYVLHVVRQVILVLDSTQAVDLSKQEILFFRYGEHLFSLGVRQKLTALVQQLECVPLHGVVTGGEDDTSCSLLANDSKLGGRRGSQTDVHHMATHAAQSRADQHINHLTADTCIAADDDRVVAGHCLTALCRVCGSEANDIYGIQTLAYATAYSAAYAGNTFN